MDEHQVAIESPSVISSEKISLAQPAHSEENKDHSRPVKEGSAINATSVI
jgi:hypothetical protein